MEPVASPKVSCLGKIKQKKKAAKAPKKPGGLAALMCGGAIGRMFRRRVGPSGSPTSCREAAEEDEAEKRFPPAQPAIGWRKEESSGQRLEDLPGGAVVPVPKQEVNLWRRRGMAQPIPLQVARR
ncbi:hypothetical protein AXF42_Ash007058 [Apostasia shenzhenica]|uniref:Uncharacterized protein n=1 Tax=Apostasia shenzhenica TaxID=1088818 RepID=A0A2I0BEZ0_9ASPA|nr:hypothetical protein AXF42_Ash007058 [Apostasia shenzhenica]